MENNLELNNIELDNTGVNTPGTVGVDANTQQTQGDKSAWDIYTKKTHVIGRTVSVEYGVKSERKHWWTVLE